MPGGVLFGNAARASIQVAVGGGGGNGGKEGNVFVTNTGDITAEGDLSMGIAAQSVGKGGGAGGMSFAGEISPVNGNAGAVNVAVGGNGAGGGDAGAVIVRNTGDIRTAGGTPKNGGSDPKGLACEKPPCVRQYGISAQSVGGGGGTGGLAGTVTLSPFVGETRPTTTFNLNTSVGGTGGAAGKGGDVRVTNFGAISTLAGESSAIFAQSVSGGGGVGGEALHYTFKPLQPEQVNVVSSSVTVGGKGGNGQVGGKVTVENEGTLRTAQYGSHGIFAQSVGGGGGQGGNTGSFQFTLSCVSLGRQCLDNHASAANNWKLTLKMGGDGGTGNHGEVVTVNNAADITTTGGGSDAIHAESIGGGGGNGGNDSDYTFLPSSIPIFTGDRTSTFNALEIGIGGNGGAQGNGGDVNVTQNGHRLDTSGGSASGIWAQSVGGGGGTAEGGTVAAGDLTGTPAVSVGGRGGAAGNGGAVTVNVRNGARISTSGERLFSPNGKPIENVAAYGIFAQSVGGGGGVGGTAQFHGIPGGGFIPGCSWCGKVSVGAGLPINLGGGNGGNGGAVTVNLNGSIETGSQRAPGHSSHAIVAQSVGGGGGIAGFYAINPISGVALAFGTMFGSGSAGGSAGPVSVNFSNGKITTWGDASHGILAQSAGSGSNTRTTADSPGRAVTIDLTGGADIDAKGRNSVGIWAQSAGTNRSGQPLNGNITVNIGKGSVVNGGTGVRPTAVPASSFGMAPTTTSSTTAARSLRAVQMPSCIAARAGSRSTTAVR